MSDSCESNILLAFLNLRFSALKDEIMSQISEKLDALKASQDAAVVRVTEDVASLQAQIDELRAQVTTPEDIAKVDAMQAVADALDPVKPDTLPEGPAPE